MTMELKEDLRIVKTKQALRNAILELVKTNDINKITIKQICDSALVNRMTFYKYYEDKYHLLNDVLLQSLEDTFVEEPLESGASDCNNSLEKESIAGSDSVLYKLVETIESKREVLDLFKKQDNAHINKIIYDVMYGYAHALIRHKSEARSMSPVAQKILCSFIAGGVMSVLSYWADNIQHITKDELINEMKIMIETAVEPEIKLFEKIDLK